ncbi:hypothetical protein [Pseudoalteromonas tunicata]|jgi:hypothetical protein|uniref:Orphan protein n=1 Tax=Pseudoalteromonas tunicata D2 TaxID=87626 RepID=A4CF73_9GAMM|nr:hypothetical protein [Pseudoalteromonas tunicata]ATC96221.1 hypothetical protein PTUN_a3975 [Pseudoalteromonas tunicata]AXT31737.1 hypothetical protein D1819_13500 [Pseudoalteromonas tunicata]EAR26621.1 hypothetical protein PTD2_00392 [Pseudoalteromonas tunicata D2]MDP4985610.1 hypothetical protein [Pseudoalteromonas tunicata]
MNKILLISSVLLCSSAIAQPIDVGGAIYELRFSDFNPIQVPYAGSQAVIAYEATIDVDGDFGQDLIYKVGGSVETRWFAGNMAVSLSATCSSPNLEQPIFIGEDLDYGDRYQHVSYLAKPNFVSSLNTGGYCQSLTVRIDKEGHLSRQFYTRVTDLKFNVQIVEKLF